MPGLQFYSLNTTLLLPKYKLLVALRTPGTSRCWNTSLVFTGRWNLVKKGARLSPADTAEEPLWAYVYYIHAGAEAGRGAGAPGTEVTVVTTHAGSGDQACAFWTRSSRGSLLLTSDGEAKTQSKKVVEADTGTVGSKYFLSLPFKASSQTGRNSTIE